MCNRLSKKNPKSSILKACKLSSSPELLKYPIKLANIIRSNNVFLGFWIRAKSIVMARYSPSDANRGHPNLLNCATPSSGALGAMGGWCRGGGRGAGPPGDGGAGRGAGFAMKAPTRQCRCGLPEARCRAVRSSHVLPLPGAHSAPRSSTHNSLTVDWLPLTVQDYSVHFRRSDPRDVYLASVY